MRKIFILSLLLTINCIFTVSGQDQIIYGSDDGELVADYVGCSSYLKDSTNNDYSGQSAYDGDNSTAWCVGNGGIGEWVKFKFSPGPPEIQKIYHGKRRLYRVLIINGLAKSEKLYYANNRIKKMKIEGDDGSYKIIELKDGVLDYQSFIINIVTTTVKMTILDYYKGTLYNDTCLSQLHFRVMDFVGQKKD